MASAGHYLTPSPGHLWPIQNPRSSLVAQARARRCFWASKNINKHSQLKASLTVDF